MAGKKKAAKSNDRIEIIRIPKGASQKEIMAAARRAFTADDLAKFCQIDEEGVPFEETLARCEAIHREETAKLKKKRKRA